MPLALLSYWKLWLVLALLAAVGIQELRVRSVQSQFGAYRTQIEKQVAENKTKAALETARMAHNQTKALDALQVRLTAAESRYKRLRDSRSTPAVPSLATVTGIAETCPGEPDKPNPAVGQMERIERGIEAILELGDREIAKYVELYKLQQENAAK